MDQMEIMSPEISKLAEALAKAQGAIGIVEKNKTANAGSYKYEYADLSAMWDAIREPLSQNGLSLTQHFVEEPPVIHLITVLMHSSGQWMKSFLKIQAGNLEIQKLGSAMTYKRRYALSAILGLAASKEDDDGKAANDAKPLEQPEPKKPEFLPKDIADFIEKEIELFIAPKDTKGEWKKSILQYYKASSFENVPLEARATILNKLAKKKETLYAPVTQKEVESLPL